VRLLRALDGNPRLLLEEGWREEALPLLPLLVCSDPKELCSYRGSYRVGTLEGQIWKEVSDTFRMPEKLEAGLEKMIRQKEEDFSERDPLEVVKKWQKRIWALDNNRKRYQERAAADLVGFVELKERLQELQESGLAAESQIYSLLHIGEQLGEMRRNTDMLLESL
jgi:hypothetical protein